MITQQTITQLSTKWQTGEMNIMREYCQHLFLSQLYQQKNTQNLLFKGGTALRFIHKSPRFSEDLDFDGLSINQSIFENILLNILTKFEQNGINLEIRESKKTSGGYLGKIILNMLNQTTQIKLDISFRKKELIQGETKIIDNEFIPAYVARHLPANLLSQGKLTACLSRGKARDFFDIYFLLRADLIPIGQRDKLKEVLEKLKSRRLDFKRELQVLLPRSHHMIIKNFQQTLSREIERFL